MSCSRKKPPAHPAHPPTQVTTGSGTSRADELARRLPRSAWQRRSAGQGAKGCRYYDWAWISIDPGRTGHRWVTSPCSPARFLTIAAAAEHARQPPPPGQIPLTRNEIARLFATLIIQPARDTRHLLHWSEWRRRQY
jgi:hypothetical protein